MTDRPPQPPPDGDSSIPRYAETENCEFSEVVIFSGPGDTAIRPIRPSLRPYMGKHPPRPQPPSS
ncbi:MAG TPA: hypothetical protein VH120_21735 [Gemmataceae bacterium]|nr:hypothetical protein [Gemmataceae bacterium]